ncbi:acyl-CoA carboxylase subunit epsilon [Streptomyces sp. NPDC057499]|uniref:acyl-CoA carboxylase subunit epsilon n=1 Tax=Streptomyces sp. NPDC057499 TaxID=3346150 RepID=UPI0036D199E1
MGGIESGERKAEDKNALLRIVRGTASEEELVALTATLFSLLARRAEGREPDGGRPAVRWRPWAAATYQAPQSWR